MAVSGGNIFVANSGNGTIGEYTTSGATVNASLISGLTVPLGIAVSGGDIFVSSLGNAADATGAGLIGEYTTSGATVNASLISGLTGPRGIAVSGGDIFVNSQSKIGEYTISGTTVNASLISGAGGVGIHVEATPEPSTLALASLGAASLLAFRRRK